MLGYDRDIKRVYDDGKVLGTTLLDVYGVTLGPDVGSEMGYLYG